jgi:FtsP/CotA-like multicopper oxidase with cupredoxin domain
LPQAASRPNFERLVTADSAPVPSCRPFARLRRLHALIAIVFGVGGAGMPSPGLAQGAAPVCLLPAAPGGSVGPEPWCSELVPVPEFRSARAVLELRAEASPFGIAVTREGYPRQTLVITIDGLPDPASLGARAYVAWVTDLALGQAVRLGVVANGRNVLGNVNQNQFRILVSAEAGPEPAVRDGRIILRGTSPSVRLLGHRDVAAAGMPGIGGNEGPHAGHGAADGWPMPPMDSSMAMMPGMAGLRPDVSPFLPGQGLDSAALPLAQPRRLERLETGDTLRLEAGLVRRKVGARTFVMYAFNQQQPGPLIHVDEGATIIVDFRNALDQPTSVHWHGVRLDNRFDGAVGVTQDAVQPGERFLYEIRFPDAGLYWYHPHVREDMQQDLGLYGNMLVASNREDWLAPVHREEVVTLDDFLVTAEGLMPWGEEAPTHALMGRFGNVMMVNGETDYRLGVQRGEVVRFYLTNVANSRTFNVTFGGARVKVVASDVGRFEREQWVGSVVIAPAERYVVDVRFDEPGEIAIANTIQAINHFRGEFFPHADTLALVTVADERADVSISTAFETLRAHSEVSEEIDPFRPWFDRPPDHELETTVRVRDLPQSIVLSMEADTLYVPPMEWNDAMPMMNWLSTGEQVTWILRDRATGAENEAIDWRFRVGDVVKIRVFNTPESFHPMNHPIHVHGQRFLVLSMDGVESENLVWKDTAIVPVGSTMDILVEMSNPGDWMLHCHIAEHLSAGMMMGFTVEDAGR